MTTAAPTIAADVTVTLDDAVARELLSLGGVVEGDLPSWRLPDGTQTTDPHAALAGALRAIADRDGAAVRDAEEIPAIGGTITTTCPPRWPSAIGHCQSRRRVSPARAGARVGPQERDGSLFPAGIDGHSS